MKKAIKFIYILVGIIATFTLILTVAFLSEVLNRYKKEPEDLFGTIFFLASSGLIIIYVLWTGLYIFKDIKNHIGIFHYLASYLVGFIGFVLFMGGIISSHDRFLIPIGLLVLTCPSYYIWSRRQF